MLNGARILLVEDEALIAITAEDALIEAGAGVTLATRLSQALAFARGARFDFAVLDVNLGKETSFPAAEVLAERGIPFLFATGFGAAGLPARYADRPIVRKPYDPDILVATIARLRQGIA